MMFVSPSCLCLVFFLSYSSNTSATLTHKTEFFNRLLSWFSLVSSFINTFYHKITVFITSRAYQPTYIFKQRYCICMFIVSNVLFKKRKKGEKWYKEKKNENEEDDRINIAYIRIKVKTLFNTNGMINKCKRRKKINRTLSFCSFCCLCLSFREPNVWLILWDTLDGDSW